MQSIEGYQDAATLFLLEKLKALTCACECAVSISNLRDHHKRSCKVVGNLIREILQAAKESIVELPR